MVVQQKKQRTSTDNNMHNIRPNWITNTFTNGMEHFTHVQRLGFKAKSFLGKRTEVLQLLWFPYGSTDMYTVKKNTYFYN